MACALRAPCAVTQGAAGLAEVAVFAQALDPWTGLLVEPGRAGRPYAGGWPEGVALVVSPRTSQKVDAPLQEVPLAPEAASGSDGERYVLGWWDLPALDLPSGDYLLGARMFDATRPACAREVVLCDLVEPPEEDAGARLDAGVPQSCEDARVRSIGQLPSVVLTVP